jgi:Phenylalanyl-tRNA synthetase alpha subunit
MTLKDQLDKIRQERKEDIKDVVDLKKLDSLRVELLGKKGPITQALRGMRDLPADERPSFGQFANSVRDELQSAIETRRDELKKECSISS